MAIGGEGGEQLQQPGPRRQILAEQDRLGSIRVGGICRQVGGDDLVLAGEVLVERPLGHVGRRTQLGDPGRVDPAPVEELARRLQDPRSRAPAAGGHLLGAGPAQSPAAASASAAMSCLRT